MTKQIALQEERQEPLKHKRDYIALTQRLEELRLENDRVDAELQQQQQHQPHQMPRHLLLSTTASSSLRPLRHPLRSALPPSHPASITP